MKDLVDRKNAFKDAIVILEFTRDKEGKYMVWTHYFPDRHKDFDQEDLCVFEDLKSLSKKVSFHFFDFMKEEHKSKLVDAIKKFPDGTDKYKLTESGNIALVEYAKTSIRLNDKELEKRMKK